VRRDKILDRIKKLLRVARGRANEHESAAAAAAAERLIREYQVAHAEVILDDLSRGDQITTGDVGAWRCCPRWQGLLAVATAKLFDCEVERCDHPDLCGHETLRLYGYVADVQVARWTFEYLAEEVERLVERAWPAADAAAATLWQSRSDYRIGALHSLVERLDAAAAEKRAAEAAATPAGESQALIARAKAAAIRELFGAIDYRSELVDVNLGEPYLDGRRAGREIPVRRPIADTPHNTDQGPALTASSGSSSGSSSSSTRSSPQSSRSGAADGS